MVACEGKVLYGTWSRAEQDRKTIKRRGGSRLQVYRCRSCGGFHLGHPWGDLRVHPVAARAKLEPERVMPLVSSGGG